MISIFEPGKRSTRGRIAGRLEVFLLLVGFVGVGWFAFDQFSTWAEAKYADYELRQRIRGEQPDLKGFIEDLTGKRESVDAPRTAEVPKQSQPEQGVKPKEEGRSGLTDSRKLKRGTLIGQIEVPRLKLEAPVRSGVDEKTLRRAAGHVPYTPLPGQEGNVGIAAHRDKHFRRLRNVKVGDTIHFKTSYGDFTYRVEKLKIVMPDNVEVLDPTSHNALTLVTCYPFNYVGSAPKRFIVRAEQVAPATSATTASRKKSVAPAGS